MMKDKIIKSFPLSLKLVRGFRQLEIEIITCIDSGEPFT